MFSESYAVSIEISYWTQSTVFFGCGGGMEDGYGDQSFLQREGLGQRKTCALSDLSGRERAARGRAADEDRMIRDEENRIVVPGPAFLIEKKKWLYVSIMWRDRTFRKCYVSLTSRSEERRRRNRDDGTLMEIISSYFKERLVAFHDAKNASLMMEKSSRGGGEGDEMYV